jgi:hypothetical protein
MIEREIHLTFSITFKILSIILYFSLFNQQRVSYRGVWCVEITNSIQDFISWQNLCPTPIPFVNLTNKMIINL